jgi:hypothetical protein
MNSLVIAAAGCALLLAAAASAQPRSYEIPEIAGDLAYGFCPLFLADMFPLDDPRLAERGFSPAVAKLANARFGELRMVSARRSDGEVAFGGVPGRICTVVVTGDKRSAALAKLREAMSWTGLAFKPAPHTGAKLPGVAVDTFKAPVHGQTLVLQLIQSGGATPAVSAQLFGMAE